MKNFYLEDANGKLLVKVFIVTLFIRKKYSDRRCPFSM